MSIFMIGIDHNMAPVDVRALFAFTRKNTGEALLKLEKSLGSVVYYLSTCNRLELWVSADDEKPELYQWLCSLKGMCRENNTRSILSAEKMRRLWSIFFILPAD